MKNTVTNFFICRECVTVDGHRFHGIRFFQKFFIGFRLEPFRDANGARGYGYGFAVGYST